MRAGEMEDAAVDIAEGLWPVTGERMASEPFVAKAFSTARHVAEGRPYVVLEFEGYKVLGYQSNVGLSDWAERWVLVSVLDSSLAGFRANTRTVYDVLQWASFWVLDRTVDGDMLQAWHLFGPEDLPDQGHALTLLLTNYSSMITGDYWEELARSDGLWPVLGTPVSTRTFRRMRLIERIARPGLEDLFLSKMDGVSVLCVRAALGDEQGLERWVFIAVSQDALESIKAGSPDICDVLGNSEVWVADRSHSAFVKAWRLSGLSALPDSACLFQAPPTYAAIPCGADFNTRAGWQELEGRPAFTPTDAEQSRPLIAVPVREAPRLPLASSPVSWFFSVSPPASYRAFLQLAVFVMLLAVDLQV